MFSYFSQLLQKLLYIYYIKLHNVRCQNNYMKQKKYRNNKISEILQNISNFTRYFGKIWQHIVKNLKKNLKKMQKFQILQRCYYCCELDTTYECMGRILVLCKHLHLLKAEKKQKRNWNNFFFFYKKVSEITKIMIITG